MPTARDLAFINQILSNRDFVSRRKIRLSNVKLNKGNWESVINFLVRAENQIRSCYFGVLLTRSPSVHRRQSQYLQVFPADGEHDCLVEGYDIRDCSASATRLPRPQPTRSDVSMKTLTRTRRITGSMCGMSELRRRCRRY